MGLGGCAENAVFVLIAVVSTNSTKVCHFGSRIFVELGTPVTDQQDVLALDLVGVEKGRTRAKTNTHTAQTGLRGDGRISGP
jgi:hypothetical protein